MTTTTEDPVLLANIAVLAAFEALELMSKKAGVSPETILDAVLADEDGNTGRYFKSLVKGAIAEVPAMLAAGP